ncbi:hypothetical protein PUN28_011122 [Cardiocondyla obscurior]|uniref:Uncharacterized protein n=1 Tax=Cardiocondyla obscurior TaxID=286306 RepID=A0AAW2FPK6_9HYME
MLQQILHFLIARVHGDELDLLKSPKMFSWTLLLASRIGSPHRPRTTDFETFYGREDIYIHRSRSSAYLNVKCFIRRSVTRLRNCIFFFLSFSRLNLDKFSL